VGTTFLVHLPGRLKTTADAIHSAFVPAIENIPVKDDLPGAQSSAAGHNHPIVLLVEDHVDMQLFLRQSIQDHYHVLQAENGRIGLELAIEHIPDLIVSDIMMPEMDGFTLCRALREDARTCHIPIVLLTARAEAADRLQGIECGADVYLTKPFDAAELNLRIRKLIEQRSVLQQKYSSKLILQPADIAVSSLDKKFLKDLLAIIEKRLDDPALSLEALGKYLNMSRSQLHRKLKALTGESPGDFLRRFRLQRAAQLLRKSEYNISEIGYQVGFSTHAHFTKTFRDQFGCAPSEYRQQETP
jgi:YesN/AraC family two-component response regulator